AKEMLRSARRTLAPEQFLSKPIRGRRRLRVGAGGVLGPQGAVHEPDTSLFPSPPRRPGPRGARPGPVPRGGRRRLVPPERLLERRRGALLRGPRGRAPRVRAHQR